MTDELSKEAEKAAVKRRRKRSSPESDCRRIDEICLKRSPEELAEQYISFCLEQNEPRLPNMAGFFRWMRLSAAAREHFKVQYPEKYQTIRMFFEDEALNSPLPPSIVSSYMKQFFAKDENDCVPIDKPSITLLFEHDIVHDGE